MTQGRRPSGELLGARRAVLVAYQHIKGRQKDSPRSRCSSSLDPHSLSVKWGHTSMLGGHWDSECQRVLEHTVFIVAFLSVYGCTRKGTVSKGYKKPNSIFREQETKKLESPPSRCAGIASGLLSPIREEGPDGAGHLNGLWWSRRCFWTSLLSSPHMHISHRARECHLLL